MRIIFFGAFLFVITEVRSQHFNFFPEARHIGLAYAIAALEDQGFGSGNPAGLHDSGFKFSYLKSVNVPFMDQISAGFTGTYRNFRTGIGVSSVGDDRYNESTLSIANAQRIGNTVIGGRADLSRP